MNEGLPKQFATPEEELIYLRARMAEREQELTNSADESAPQTIETIGQQEIREYASFTPQAILDKGHVFSEPHLDASVEHVNASADPVEDILDVARERGIRNALSVLEKVKNPFLVDEVHRALVSFIRSEAYVGGLKEGVAPWQLLHMTLYEVMLPEIKNTNDKEYQIAELVGMMEQLFASLRSLASEAAGHHLVIEIAVADNSDDIVFYVAVPNEYASLFEKQAQSLFPYAELSLKANDYNVFVDGGFTCMAEVTEEKHPIYPIKMHEGFTSDPLAVILNAFSKIEREGGGAAIQFLMRHPKRAYRKDYESIIKYMEKGMKASDAIARSTISGELMATVGDLFANKKKEEDKEPKTIDSDKIQLFGTKIKSDIVETNIRVAVSARTLVRAEQILKEIESTFNQFSLPSGNAFKFSVAKGGFQQRVQKDFAFREFTKRNIIPLSLTELSTLIHFPGNGIVSSPQFKQSQSTTAAASNDMPTEGTIIGDNKHRGVEKPIFMTELDRMRHLYIIGQTGTGKSKFMTNTIIQDIQSGNGVCMIDPHGTDIEEVLGAIPPERQKDVIYFDPSRMERAIGLNMLEYDETKPEQKTFVVNELLSIFQKLYGANPESMGPMFEQYFRNATMLVMEDPESGNTLMDISRVMADAQYRRYKLSKAKNPVVVQFWNEIATKAGGEASLENIIPYIISKTDPITSNDYLRPIVGQQKSAFNFRQIMDEKKILLVNLSKGRLGEINANLIGMIFVGKILMAALSRVDDPTRSFPPFYLHIDEFQNVSTPAIASILSEARKYKLSLTVVHQFIAQLDPVIKDAVFGNVGSLVAFRVGTEDAQFLEQQFAPVFNAKDIMNTPNFNAIVRILANGVPTKPFSVAMRPPIKSDPALIERLIEESLARYGRPRAEVEAEISARYQKKPATPPVMGGMM